MSAITYALHNARSSLRIPRRCDHTRRSPLAARRSPLAARRFIHVRAGRCMRSNSRGRCGRAASFGVKVRVDVGYHVRASQRPLVSQNSAPLRSYSPLTARRSPLAARRSPLHSCKGRPVHEIELARTVRPRRELWSQGARRCRLSSTRCTMPARLHYPCRHDPAGWPAGPVLQRQFVSTINHDQSLIINHDS